MPKRATERQLTLENYDDDEDVDECGDNRPSLASSEVMKSRPIAKPKRRSDLNSGISIGSTEPKRSAFSGFSGFNMTSASTSSSSALRSLPQMATNGAKMDDNPKTVSLPIGSANSEDIDDDYNKKLLELNKTFVEHVSKYRDQFSHCNFSIVCEEYIEYHKKIEIESKGQTTVGQPMRAQISVDPKTSEETNSDQHKSAVVESSQASAIDETMFAKPNHPFSFLESLGAIEHKKNESMAGSADNGDEECDEPPIVESIAHKEPDSLYTQRCKLYYKKDNEWAPKGVGYLYIKKAPNATTPQLLIRADHRLGNILLHISLMESLPIWRAAQSGGVLLSCVPNPALDPKAKPQTTVTFLIRVKTPEESDQLFDTLNKFKSN